MSSTAVPEEQMPLFSSVPLNANKHDEGEEPHKSVGQDHRNPTVLGEKGDHRQTAGGENQSESGCCGATPNLLAESANNLLAESANNFLAESAKPPATPAESATTATGSQTHYRDPDNAFDFDEYHPKKVPTKTKKANRYDPYAFSDPEDVDSDNEEVKVWGYVDSGGRQFIVSTTPKQIIFKCGR